MTSPRLKYCSHTFQAVEYCRLIERKNNNSRGVALELHYCTTFNQCYRGNGTHLPHNMYPTCLQLLIHRCRCTTTNSNRRLCRQPWPPRRNRKLGTTFQARYFFNGIHPGAYTNALIKRAHALLRPAGAVFVVRRQDSQWSGAVVTSTNLRMAGNILRNGTEWPKPLVTTSRSADGSSRQSAMAWLNGTMSSNSSWTIMAGQRTQGARLALLNRSYRDTNSSPNMTRPTDNMGDCSMMPANRRCSSAAIITHAAVPKLNPYKIVSAAAYPNRSSSSFTAASASA